MNEKQRFNIEKNYKVIMRYFMYFFMTSVIGWIYEVLVIMLENHNGFQNRGALYGPYLPIYGIGMLILLLTVNPIRKIKLGKLEDKSKIIDFMIKLILIFLATVVVTSLVELLGSYMISIDSWTDANDGTSKAMWYYSANQGYSINFQGRIALKSSLRFGLGGTLVLYLIKPVVDVFSKQEKLFKIITTIFGVIFILDIFASFILVK